MSKPASDSRTSAPMIRERRMLPDRLVARVVPVDPVLLHEHAGEAEVRGDGRDLARVVRLHAADRDERVAALRERVGGEVLELAHLVAAVGEAGVAVLPLGPDLDLAAEVLGEAIEAVDRGGAEGERDAGEVGEGGHGPMFPETALRRRIVQRRRGGRRRRRSRRREPPPPMSVRVGPRGGARRRRPRRAGAPAPSSRG